MRAFGDQLANLCRGVTLPPVFVPRDFSVVEAVTSVLPLLSSMTCA
jgi:hypothetical protein